MLLHALVVGFVALAALLATATPAPAAPARPAAAGPSTSWIRCAAEYQGCTFEGRREVRYVLNGVATTATSFAGLHCSPETFGLSVGGSGAAVCDYSATLLRSTITNPSPGMAGLGSTVAVPQGHPGSTRALVQTFDDRGAPSTSGAFRTNCQVSHFSFDDPIVFPGQPGRSHLHMFFGNTGTNAFSTSESIATTGGSTCAGGILNRSAYWMPAVLDGNGVPVLPASQIFYYKTGGIEPSRIQPLPEGLRMVTGNSRATTIGELGGRHSWGCIETYIPTTATIQQMARLCGAGNHLNFSMSFPQCWNGNLDSPDHASHLTAPVNGNCPASHPTPLPEITFNVRFTIPADLAAGWHLASDMYDHSSIGGGLSAHIDWFGGWDPSTMNAWVRNCDQASVDCHGYLLGDGRILEDPSGTSSGGDATPELPPVAPATVGATAAFVPLPSPRRILDTRAESAVGFVGDKPAAGDVVTMRVAGAGGVPATGASAVVLNVTATEASAPGFVTVWPDGPMPTASSVNLEDVGHTRPNTVTVPIGADGSVRLFTQSGTHLVADVAGYFVPATTSAAGRLQFVEPTRVLDTRPATSVGYTGTAPGAGSTVRLSLLGRAGLPSTGVAAVVLNVTATEALAPGYVTVWPGGPRPTASNLNLPSAGSTIANQVIVPVGADGAVQLFTQSGAHLVADVAGWYTDASAAVSGRGLFVPVTPYRLFDSRTTSRRGEGSTLTLMAAAAPAAAAGRAGLAMNVTATETSAPGWLAVWPSGPMPVVSNLNVSGPGQTIANHVITATSASGGINLHTNRALHVVVDVTGWYTG